MTVNNTPERLWKKTKVEKSVISTFV